MKQQDQKKKQQNFIQFGKSNMKSETLNKQQTMKLPLFQEIQPVVQQNVQQNKQEVEEEIESPTIPIFQKIDTGLRTEREEKVKLEIEESTGEILEKIMIQKNLFLEQEKMTDPVSITLKAFNVAIGMVQSIIDKNEDQPYVASQAQVNNFQIAYNKCVGSFNQQNLPWQKQIEFILTSLQAVSEVIFAGNSGICRSSNLGSFRKAVVLQYTKLYIRDLDYQLSDSELQLLASYNDTLFKINQKKLGTLGKNILEMSCDLLKACKSSILQ